MSDKMCGSCKKVKRFDEFYRKAAAADGRQTACKACHRQMNREYHQRQYQQMPKIKEWRQIHTKIPTAVHAQVKLEAKRNGRSLGYEITELLRLGLAVRQERLLRGIK